MGLGRGWTSAVTLVWTAVVCAAPAWAQGQAPPSAPEAPPSAADRPAGDAPVDPGAEAYKQHMSNGVKLFQDKNFAAAIVEFQAAYDAKPKASPLINIALCHKGLFHYPKAVAALRAALDKHGDTMDPADKKAAEGAITEMSALLAYVTVRVSPEHAIVSIDGEDQPAGITKKPIPLGPGPHKIAARASGHAGAEASVSVASGDKSKQVLLELAPDKGYVRVRAPDAQRSIAIDQKPLARGAWEGYVAPGRHVVQVYKTGGSSAALEVLVAAGKAQQIELGSDGALSTKAISGVPFFGRAASSATDTPDGMDAPPDPALGKAGDKGSQKEAKKDPPLSGLYGHAAGSVFALVAGGPALDDTEFGGYCVGVRGGYRINTAFGLELMLDYSRLGGGSDEGPGVSGQDGPIVNTDYELESIRIGGNIRFMSPGYRARFVAAMGIGFAYDAGELLLTSADDADDDSLEGDATNVYFNLEQGVEFNIRHFLVGLVVQQIAGTTGRLVESAQFGGGQITIGLGLRVGYGRW